MICVDNLETGSLAERRAPARRQFRLRATTTSPSHLEVDEPVDFVFHLASPASPIDYLRLPLQTLKVGSYGTHNALGLAKWQARALPARLDQRGLRRSGGASAAGDVLGQRQPDRAARRV